MITEQRIIFIWSLVIFMSVPAFTEIYVVTFRQTPHSQIDTRSNENPMKARGTKESQPRTFIHKLVSILTHKKTTNMDFKAGNKCIRLFGSIYGTQSERKKCLERLKKKSVISSTRLPEDYKEYAQWQYDPLHYDDMVYYEHEYPFSDFTQNFVIPKVHSTEGTKLQSSDTLRTNQPTVYFISGFRRNSPDNVGIAKRNMNVETSDESSSDDEDASDSDIKPTKSIVMPHKKPKRFQIIENGDVTDDGGMPTPNELTSTEVDLDTVEIENEELSQSDEFSKKKKPKPKKPAKSKQTRDTFYLQGNHIVNLNSDDDDYRKKMQTFLPKRFHWAESELLQDLGYYWFNGPQGRYPHYAVRP